jgi:hypothetical protein
MVDRTDPLPAMTRLTQALLRVAEDGIYLGVGCCWPSAASSCCSRQG